MSVQIQNSTVTLYTGHGFFSFFNRIGADHFLNLYCVVVMNIWHENGFWLFLRTHQKKNVLKIGPKKKVEIKRYLFDRWIVSKFSKYVFEENIKYIHISFFLNWCWLQYFIECQIETPSLYCCCGWFMVTELPICSPNSKPQKSWEMGSTFFTHILLMTSRCATFLKTNIKILFWNFFMCEH